MDVLHLNWIVYIATTSLETALLVVWVGLYHDLYGFGSAGFYIYLAVGAGLAAKLIINLVSQDNMKKWMEEVKEAEEEGAIGFEEFIKKPSKKGLTLVILK